MRSALAPPLTRSPMRQPNRALLPIAAGLLLLLVALSALFGGHRLASAGLRTGPVAVAYGTHPDNPISTASGIPVTQPKANTVNKAKPARIRVASSRQERRHSAQPSPVRQPVLRHRMVPVLPSPQRTAIARRRLPKAARAIRITRIPHRIRPNPPNRPNPPSKPFPANAPVQRAAAVTDALAGTWHGWQGIHSHDPAVLTIEKSNGRTFNGVMMVRTPDHATVRVALTGLVRPGGKVLMRETRVLSSTKPNAWDLGFKSGRLGPNGRMAGSDHDVKGRTAQWSFQR